MSKRTDRVAVLGIGGGGAEILSHLGRLPEAGSFDLAVADSDARTFDRLRGILEIPLGHDWGCTQGCGGDVQLGERVAAASAEAVRQFIDGASLLLVVAGLGGGTGSGAAPMAARLANDAGVPAFFVVTLPFAFEGNWRRRQAEAVLTPLRELSDAVVVVRNDLMFTTLSADIPAKQAFEQADAILAGALSGLGSMVWADWMIRTDFAAIRSLLRQNPADCHLGVGDGTGPQRCEQAVESFLACPLVGGPETLRRADAAVIMLQSSDTVSVGELQNCLGAMQQYFSDQARLLVGACTSQANGDGVQLTGLICRQGDTPAPEPAETATHRAAESGTAAPAHGGRQERRARREPGAIQGELPLQEQSLGIFSGTVATLVGGDNLDIPTFQRRGIHLDAGD